MAKPLRFGPPPETRFEVQPTAAEIEFFREHGYLVVERITTDEEIDWIRQIYEFIFSPEQAERVGAPVDRSGTRTSDEPVLLSQAFMPEVRFPELLTTVHWRNAKRYAAALLGVGGDELTSWGHMIRKPPGGRAALWHQDHAYWEPELDYHAALGVWLPMHDVSVEMGAMQFVPGSHRLGLLPHEHADAPENNVLTVAVPIDTTQAVACPLKKGGATFHHNETLHYTAPNTTTETRYAYPMEFQTRPVRREIPLAMPWVDERRAATGETHNPVISEDGRFLRV
jgi:ectoine hydroxylase-related dioxygenase (phytanoyl-CoA dioxygenase family)